MYQLSISLLNALFVVLNIFTQRCSLLFIFIPISLVHVILPVQSIAFLNSRLPSPRADILERGLRERTRERNWRGERGGGGNKDRGSLAARAHQHSRQVMRREEFIPLPLPPQRGGCCLCKCNHESRPVAIAPGIMPRSAWNDYSVALNSSHFVARQFGTRRQSLRIIGRGAHYPI